MTYSRTAQSERYVGEAITTIGYVSDEHGVALTAASFSGYDFAIWLNNDPQPKVLLEGQPISDVISALRFDIPSFATTGYNFEHVIEYGANDFFPVGDCFVRIEYVLHRIGVTRPIVLVHLATLHNARVIPMLEALAP